MAGGTANLISCIMWHIERAAVSVSELAGIDSRVGGESFGGFKFFLSVGEDDFLGFPSGSAVIAEDVVWRNLGDWDVVFGTIFRGN